MKPIISPLLPFDVYSQIDVYSLEDSVTAAAVKLLIQTKPLCVEFAEIIDREFWTLTI